MPGKCKIFLGLIAALTAVRAPADPAAAATRLIQRVLPNRAAAFRVEIIPPAKGRDVYEIESRGGRIILRGNTAGSAAAAFNAYLRQFCHAHISWNAGNQLNLPNPLPAPPARIRVVSPYPYRFCYNYCTHGYTLAWRHWPRWERELDFLAMQGVNLALVIEGQEQVWIDALGTLGYSEAAVRRWLCLPSHQPWQYMDNMEAYGGPVPASLVRRRLELGRRIIRRMRELGIEPVLPGYYGMAPPDFHTRFPQARVHPQGRWGNQRRPDLLDPTDPLFAKLANAFYTAQRVRFGPVHFYSADPFHEGGRTRGIDLPACARAIFAAMQRAAPGAIWVLQAWSGNPRRQILEALPRKQLLVLDLFCEYRETWRQRNQFGHTPWLWCTIHNFGGNNGLDANFDRVARGPVRALEEAGPGKGWMRGIGAVMEGSETNPMLWEMFFGNAWRTKAPEIQAWIRAYARRRYGADDPHAVAALDILYRTAYAARPGPAQFPHNSAVCALPSLNPDQRAQAFTSTRPKYDPCTFARAWRELLRAAPRCAASDGYRYDAADFGRQVLADLGTRYHRAICYAWRGRDKEKLVRFSHKMLALIRAMDTLMATRREFLFGVWQRDARAWGQTPAESDLCEENARALLTTWTVPQCWGDYANREWAGLLRGFYLHRWKLWLDALQKGAAAGWRIQVGTVRKAILDWEYAWIRSHEPYPAEPSGDTLAVARRLLAEFGADAENPAIGRAPQLQLRRHVSPRDFFGRWRYQADGVDYVREIRPDGSLRLYRAGKLYSGWKGYTWKFSHDRIELRKADGTVFGKHALTQAGDLVFIGEPWGIAKKESAPAATGQVRKKAGNAPER